MHAQERLTCRHRRIITTITRGCQGCAAGPPIGRRQQLPQLPHRGVGVGHMLSLRARALPIVPVPEPPAHVDHRGGTDLPALAAHHLGAADSQSWVRY